MTQRYKEKAIGKRCKDVIASDLYRVARDKTPILLDFIPDTRHALYDNYFSMCIKELRDGVRIPELDKKLGAKITFFKEDIYVPDLMIFYSQYYDMISKGSSVFFKSNLVNFAFILACFNRGCMKPFFEQYYLPELVYKRIDIPRDIVNSLETAYMSCAYNDVLAFYIKYITFFSKTVTLFMKDMVSELLYNNVYIKRFRNIKYINTRAGDKVREAYDESTNYDTYTNDWTLDKRQKLFEGIREDIIHLISSQNSFFYISCNLVGEDVSARFIPTSIKVSHAGFKIADGFIFDTLDLILHDFRGHMIAAKNCIQQNCQDIIEFFICIQNEPFASLVYEGLWALVNETDEFMNPTVSDLISFPIHIADTPIAKPINKIINKDGSVNADELRNYIVGYGQFPEPHSKNPIPTLRSFAMWLFESFDDFPYKDTYMNFLKNTA